MTIFDPGLILARKLAAPCSSPHVTRPAGAPTPLRGARILECLLVAAVVAMPLAAGVAVSVWWLS